MLIAIAHRRWTVLPVAAGLTLLMLLGAVAAGLRVPGFSYLGRLPGFGLLDYRTLSGSSFLPLRADYLDELLGTGFGGGGAATTAASAAAAGSSDPFSVAASGIPPFGAAPPALDSRPVVLDHRLTNDDMNKPDRGHPAAVHRPHRHQQRDPAEREPDSCSRAGAPPGTSTPPPVTGCCPRTPSAATTPPPSASSAVRPDALEQVSCSPPAPGKRADRVPATRGSTYLFQVTGVLGGGRLVFHLAPPGRPACCRPSFRVAAWSTPPAGPTSPGTATSWSTRRAVTRKPRACRAAVRSTPRTDAPAGRR
jgi:hypothetical protein